MKPRRMHITVGTLLLGLGGCASASDADGGCKPPKCHINPGPEELGIPPQPVPTDTAAPDPTPEPPIAEPPADPKNGGCEPPNCHINPGPTDDPGAKPEPTVEPKPKPDPTSFPRRVNPGPNG